MQREFTIIREKIFSLKTSLKYKEAFPNFREVALTLGLQHDYQTPSMNGFGILPKIIHKKPDFTLISDVAFIETD